MADQQEAIVGEQALQHEHVLLVGTRPGPVQCKQRQQVAEYAEYVECVREQVNPENRKHRRRGRRRSGCVRHGQLHRIVVVVCAFNIMSTGTLSPHRGTASKPFRSKHVIGSIITIIITFYHHLYYVCRVNYYY